MSGFLTQWGISEETTFGTPIADSGTFIAFESQIATLDPGIYEDRSIKHAGNYYALAGNSLVTQSGGLRVISFSGLRVRRTDAALLMYAVTQNVSEAASGTYQKDFDIDSNWAPPDFSSDAGLFYTLAIKDTLANFHRKFTSCILRKLTLSADLTGGDGSMIASGEWISGFTADTTANMSGTWAFQTQNYYDWAAPTTKNMGGASDLILSSFEITFDNKAVRVGNDSSGDAQNYILSATGFEITGSLTALYDGVTDTALANWLSGTTQALTLQQGTDDSAGWIDLSFTAIQFTGNDQDYENEKGRMLTMPFMAMGDGSKVVFNGEIQDGVDRSW